MLDFALLGVCLAMLAYYLLAKDHHSDGPPGPRGLPIFGNLIDLVRASDNITKTLGVLGEKYGEIFSVKMGFKRTVVLTSKEAMQTVLTNEATLARDNSGMYSDWSFHKNLGIITSHGSVWSKTRNWTFKMLREFGFGKSLAMEGYIQIALDLLFAKIDDKLGTEVNVDYFFHQPILTTMWLMIVGRISEDDKAHLTLISETTERFIKSSVLGPSLVNAFPFLRFVFPNWLGHKVQMDFFRTCTSIGKKLFDEMGQKLKASPLTSQPANLLEAFVQNCGKDDEIFNCKNFQVVFQDLLMSSSDSSSSFLESVVLYFIAFPDIQEKIYKEILDVAPNGKVINFEDRKRMPYTQAFILETHRNARTAQNLGPRRVLWDFLYKNYKIKKGTIIVADTRLYCENKQIWGDPEVFRPERFIGENGEIENASSVISFSFGKRNCPGELHANIVTFLILTALLQRYKISKPIGQPTPRLDMKPGLALKPHPFQVVFEKRNSKI
ncbi:farnesoate epoxidase isoform X1 [Folsomia candida]|uniref:farnesoate epoxidase isoform X1 n=1 Tax=Folsomia candida TaxID=158441 RepID=UPI000B90711D|nr:farnesoate epoxidase isoform X1 [Folsomia candida]